MSKEELEEVIEYEDYEEEQEELSDNDKVEQNSTGQVKFKSVNHSKRAEANEVESDGEIATYANYALEYFGHRCALSGERFVAFNNPVERKKYKKIITNLSAEHVLALTTGGNDIIPNVVPTVLQYNIQKNGYYILDWWPKAKDVNGNSIYSPERLLKLVNYMLKSLHARKDLGIKKNPREYRKRLLKPNEIDEFLSKEEIAEKLLSDTITATTELEDGKNILTKIPQKEGEIPSLVKQKDKEIKITEAMFLTDALEVLEKEEKIPQEIIFKLKNMYKEVEGEIHFEIEVRKNILSVLEQMEVTDNKYTIANDLLVNSDILEILGKLDKNADINSMIQEYMFNRVEKLKKLLSEEQLKLAISNNPEILYKKECINKIGFWKENRTSNLEEILFRGNNSTDYFIDCIIILQQLGIDTSQMIQTDTIESLAKKYNIGKKQLEKVNLNSKYKIGRAKDTISSYYRKITQGEKTKGIPPTEDQVQELSNLGISLELKNKINPTDEFIRKIKKLKDIGVDITQIIASDTLESLSQKSGINIEILEEFELNPKDEIGSTKDRIAVNYRKAKKGEKTNGTPPTDEQIQELLKLGLSLELKKTQVEIFIENIKILQRLNIDTSKLEYKDTIESLAKKSGIPIVQLQKHELDLHYNIGHAKSHILTNYRNFKQGKKCRKPPTREQVEEILQLGFFLEDEENNNYIEEFIQKMKKIQMLGIDISQLKFNDTIESLAQKNGITKKILEEHGLIPNDAIGHTKSKIAGNYRKEQKEQEIDGTAPTKKQVQELLMLGISLELPKTSVERFIEKLEVLQGLGIDNSKLVNRDTIKSLAEKSGISEEQVVKAGLNPNDAIGGIKNSIIKNFRDSKLGRKTNGKPPTDTQIQKLLEFGITLGRNSKKIFKDTVKQNKGNLSEAMQAGEELETEILMAEKVAERSASDGRG